jgi:uncharacterized protein with PIN domain
MIYVLDASAMIALLRDETGADVVDAALADTESVCLAHAVNLCEVYYDAVRQSDERAAYSMIQDLYAAGVQFREDMDMAFWQEVGRYKGAYGRVSVADCFGITMTRRVNGEFLTGDHHEFDRIVPLGLCRVQFIR